MSEKDRTVGILGGKGPEATRLLFQLIIERTPVEKEEDHLRILIDNNPRIPKPALGITGEGPDPRPALVETGRNLERAGADFIIIACNSAHYYIDEIRNAVDIPLLSIISETVSHVRAASQRNIGLLASTGLIRSRIYQREFERAGITALCPGAEEQEALMEGILRFKNTGEKKNLETAVDHITRRLISRGAEGLVVACTDIPVVFRGRRLSVPCFDTLEVLATAAVRMAKAG